MAQIINNTFKLILGFAILFARPNMLFSQANKETKEWKLNFPVTSLPQFDSLSENKYFKIKYVNLIYKNGKLNSKEHIEFIYHRTKELIRFYMSCRTKDELIIYQSLGKDSIKVVAESFYKEIRISRGAFRQAIDNQRMDASLFREFYVSNDFSNKWYSSVYKNKYRIEYYNESEYFYKGSSLNIFKIRSKIPVSTSDQFYSEKNKIQIVQIDSINFEILKSGNDSIFQSIITRISKTKADLPEIDSAFLNSIILKDVILKSGASFNPNGYTIIDFSHLSCAPCWVNFKYLDSIYSVVNNNYMIIADPHYNETKHLKIIQSRISRHFQYCSIQSQDKIENIIRSYPQIVIFDQNFRIVYRHFGLLTEKEVIEIINILQS